MPYRVRVKDSGYNLGGCASDGARFKVMPGEYDVELTTEGTLVFVSSDTRDDGDLSVTLREYIELEDFPELPPNRFIEILAS